MLDAVIERSFDQVLERMRTTIDARLYELWFTKIRLLRFQRGTMTIGVTSVFARDWMDEQYRTRLEDAAQDVLGTRVRVVLEVSDDLRRELRAAERPEIEFPVEAKPGPQIRPTFENFACVEENLFAVRALRSVAESGYHGQRPATISLVGPAGTGKTHLLHAFSAKCRAVRGPGKYLMIDALGFANRYTLALKNKTMSEFRDAMTGARAVCFDEVHRLKGKTATQREFITLLERWLSDGAQVVIAGRHLPSDIHDLSESVRSRLEGGLSATIRPYRVDSLVSILDATFPPALRLIAPDVRLRIARGAHGHVGTFRDRLGKALHYSKVVGKPLTVALLTDELATLDAVPEAQQDGFDRLVVAICTHCQVKRDDILSKRKLKSLIRPRGWLVCLLRDRMKLTFKEIGRRLGNRSHTSVFLLYKKYSTEVAARPDLIGLAIPQESAERGG